MKMERQVSHRKALGVGLGLSAALHVAMILGYGVFVSNPVASADPAATPVDAPTPALEVVRLVGPPAPVTNQNAALASADAAEAVSSPHSPRTVRAILTENPAARDLSLRMTSVSAPVQSEVAALPAVPVNTLAGQVDAPTGADGWFPGKYTIEHDDHEHRVVNGFVLGVGPSCSYSGVYTSVNRSSPFGG